MVVLFVSLEFVGCPVMENDKIVQQPVDLTTLGENCDNAAVEFIYRASGMHTATLLLNIHTYLTLCVM